MGTGGYDIYFGGEKFFSIQTDGDENQLDTYLFAKGPHVHSFEVQAAESGVSVGVQMTDPQGDVVDDKSHLLPAARIRTLTPGRSLELGRLWLDTGRGRIEFAVTHGDSAVSSSPAPSLPNVRRRPIELPGGSGGPATWCFSYKDSPAEASASNRTTVRLFDDRWLEFVREG